MKININKVYKSDARLNAFPEVKAVICRIQNTLALHGCYYDLPMNVLAYLLTIAQLDSVRKLRKKITEIADFKVKPKMVAAKNTALNKNSWAYEVKAKLSHIGRE